MKGNPKNGESFISRIGRSDIKVAFSPTLCMGSTYSYQNPSKWYLQTMERSSEIRRNKLLTHAAWLNLKNMNIKWEKPQATDHILYNSILWNIQKIPKTGLCIFTKNYWFVHSEWVNFIIWKLDLNTLLSTVCNSDSGSAREAPAPSLFWGLSRQEQNHAGVTAPLVGRGADTALPAPPALVN